MTEKLSNTEVQQKLKGLENWEWVDNAIKKQFVFKSFMQAVQFVNRVAERAEAADHHPDIAVHYRKVTMVLSTHSAGGLTQKDFSMAKQIDAAVQDEDRPK